MGAGAVWPFCSGGVLTADLDSNAERRWGRRRLYLHPVVVLTSFGRLNEFRGGRAPLRPAERSARACCVDRPPALFSNAVEESEALGSLHSQARRENLQGRGAGTAAYPRRSS